MSVPAYVPIALFLFSVVAMVFAPIMTWVERKQSALMQDRIGANRADILGIKAIGLLHPIADVIKMITKEDMVPTGANRLLIGLGWAAVVLVGCWRTRQRAIVIARSQRLELPRSGRCTPFVACPTGHRRIRCMRSRVSLLISAEWSIQSQTRKRDVAG